MHIPLLLLFFTTSTYAENVTYPNGDAGLSPRAYNQDHRDYYPGGYESPPTHRRSYYDQIRSYRRDDELFVPQPTSDSRDFQHRPSSGYGEPVYSSSPQDTRYWDDLRSYIPPGSVPPFQEPPQNTGGHDRYHGDYNVPATYGGPTSYQPHDRSFVPDLTTSDSQNFQNHLYSTHGQAGYPQGYNPGDRSRYLDDYEIPATHGHPYSTTSYQPHDRSPTTTSDSQNRRYSMHGQYLSPQDTGYLDNMRPSSGRSGSRSPYQGRRRSGSRGHSKRRSTGGRSESSFLERFSPVSGPRPPRLQRKYGPEDEPSSYSLPASHQQVSDPSKDLTAPLSEGEQRNREIWDQTTKKFIKDIDLKESDFCRHTSRFRHHKWLERGVHVAENLPAKKCEQLGFLSFELLDQRGKTRCYKITEPNVRETLRGLEAKGTCRVLAVTFYLQGTNRFKGEVDWIHVA